MQSWACTLAVLVFLVSAVGCVRRDGRNSDCRWPGETVHRAPTPRHLSANAEFAEDLAIRYADTHYGLHTPFYVSDEVYEAARDGCMQTLFQDIAHEDGVSVAQVSRSLGQNRGYIDLAEILPFALLYCLATAVVVRMHWRRYPPAEQSWTPGIVMALFLSVAFAIAGTMLGEVWCGVAETLRIGYGHISYRFGRLLWGRHRPEAFVGGLAVFWVAAIAAARRAAGEGAHAIKEPQGPSTRGGNGSPAPRSG